MDEPSGNGQPEAGPSSANSSRPASPGHINSQTLRKPASHSRLAKFMLPGRVRSSSSASQEAALVASLGDNADTPSGRSTPEQRRRVGKAATASLLANDARYKKYAQQVDRCLQSFESVNEWADFISFLSRLLKTLQSVNPPYTDIPRKLVVSKRLAQCLNPALPAGVHQRALDVYSYIFSVIKSDGLRRDLLIWSSGLFPFFQFATTSVRPHLLKLYEVYYLPLEDDLRPATKALILALLPGLEEETGDFFEKVMSLLGKLSSAVTSAFFLSNIFLILITTPSARLAALNYLARKMLTPPTPENGLVETGLLIRGIAAALEDENALVRRSGLDLLLRIMKADGQEFRGAEPRDKQLLVRAISGVVLQREISLSRRVYAWFLGSDELAANQIDYFKEHGLDLLSTTLLQNMEALASNELSDYQRPFKIFLSLQDKWELGSALAERLALPALKLLMQAMEHAPEVIKQELLSTATTVYEAVEPIIIWHQVFEIMRDCMLASDPSKTGFVFWLIDSISQRDDEVLRVHAPIMADHTLQILVAQDIFTDNSLEALRIASRLVHLIPPTMLAQKTDPPAEVNDLPSLLYDQRKNPEGLVPIVQNLAVPRAVASAAKLAMQLQKQRASAPIQSEAIKLVLYLVTEDAAGLKAISPAEWLSSMLSLLQKCNSFHIVDSVASLILQASRSEVLKIDLSKDQVIVCVLDCLFRYLRQDAAMYHLRAVELLWEYNQVAKIHTLEDVIATRLSSVMNKRGGFEAFGTLWRLTDDTMLPGEIFYTPMFQILDALKSTDPELQRTAETWMRCNARSYFRILDPILSRIIEYTQKSNNLANTTYLMDSLATLLRFGGNGLSKSCQNTEMANSPHPSILKEASLIPGITYLDAIMRIMVTILSPAPTSPRTGQLLLRLESSTLEVLQLLVVRGDVSPSSLESLRFCLLEKLSRSIDGGELALQSKMLHLLHAAMPGPSTKHHKRSTSVASAKSHAAAGDFDDQLVQTIIKGVTVKTSQPILQHWIDFVLMSTAHISKRRDHLEAICGCLSFQLQSTLMYLRDDYRLQSLQDLKSSLSEAEPMMLLAGLEKLVTTLMASQSSRKSEDSTRGGNEGSSMILGLVSNVFGDGQGPINTKAHSSAYLDAAIEALLVLWTVTMESSDTKSSDSEREVYTRIRSRGRKVLEKIFKQNSQALVTSCVKVWSLNPVEITDAAMFDCVDTLTPSAQKVVEMLGDSATGKVALSTGEQSADPAVMAFIEAYILRLEAPIALQIWNTLFGIAKEMLTAASSPIAKAQLYALLRCLTALAKVVSTTSALEDRRLRRDLQDVYTKVLDAVTSNAARLSEASTWERPDAAKDHDLPLNGDVEKAAFKITEPELDLTKTVYDFIALEVIPSLRSFLLDNDRVASACSGISQSIITPAFRQQKVDDTILHVLQQMTKIPAAAKAWRFQVAEAFNDNKFFRMGVEDATAWRPLINALLDSDKERFGELLAAPSANIFTNREQEMISRSLNLRRLSFLLLAADRNHYLTQLPNIEEKLVDILRNNVVSPRVHSEVYLCLRVLMCRISPQHLTNFWPVILAELLRVFEGTMDDPPPDGSESLQLVLAACKFLDLLLVIQSEDFQIHQWMFVTDTTDAAYPPEDYMPEAIMDRMNEILTDHLHDHKTMSSPIAILDIESTVLRKPRLSHVKSVNSMQQLQGFFSRASVDTFEGVYGNTGVDWEAVEEGLQGEIFEQEVNGGISRTGTPRIG